MNLITIKTFSDGYEANVCKGRLDAAEIKCFINNENLILANPLFSRVAGGFQLQVDEKDAAEALKVLGNT
jgi:hypothetical protein